MSSEVIDWLLTGPSWLQYAVKLQLLHSKPKVSFALRDSSIMKIVERLGDEQVGISALKTGKVWYTKTGNAYWDLFFLADIGFTLDDLKIQPCIEAVFDLQLADGTFLTQDNCKPNFFCIPTILLSSLVKMGYKTDQRLKRYLDLILSTQRLDGGWHCAKSRTVGQRLQHTESCPMDNLNILMLCGQFAEYREDPRFNGALGLLLSHWERKTDNWRPYGFGVGSQFKKLKYPAIKYGILRVLDVLSLFPYALHSDLFQDMLDFVHKKSVDGKYYAESVVKSYAEFDFGQKKEASRWITFLIKRIDQRVNLSKRKVKENEEI